MEFPLTSNVQLRDVIVEDFPIFFAQQVDPVSTFMAAFVSKDPANEKAFTAHWTKIIQDEKIIKKTILFNGQIAGHILNFEQFGSPSVSYWIGKEYWGKGIATYALSLFLEHVKIRPLYARAVKDNLASVKVLQKSGFAIIGEDKGFSYARSKEVEEFILILNENL